MGKRTSVYLADDLAAAVDKTGLPLADLVRRGLYGPPARPTGRDVFRASRRERLELHQQCLPIDPLGFYVYMLWETEGAPKPLYVGSSVNVLGRLGDHLSAKVKRDRIGWITLVRCAAESDMLQCEAGLIRKYRPEWNKFIPLERADWPEVVVHDALALSSRREVPQLVVSASASLLPCPPDRDREIPQTPLSPAPDAVVAVADVAPDVVVPAAAEAVWYRQPSWRCEACAWLQAQPEVTHCEHCGWPAGVPR